MKRVELVGLAGVLNIRENITPRGDGNFNIFNIFNYNSFTI